MWIAGAEGHAPGDLSHDQHLGHPCSGEAPRGLATSAGAPAAAVGCPSPQEAREPPRPSDTDSLGERIDWIDLNGPKSLLCSSVEVSVLGRSAKRRPGGQRWKKLLPAEGLARTSVEGGKIVVRKAALAFGRRRNGGWRGEDGARKGCFSWLVGIEDKNKSCQGVGD